MGLSRRPALFSHAGGGGFVPATAIALDMNANAPVPAGKTPATPTDRLRILRAFNLSLGAVVVLVAVFALQGHFDWRPWAVAPLEWPGLLGLIGAPLLHASVEHIAANSIALIILGTLAGSVYPKATLRALPLLWIGSGIGAWLLGDPGSRHLGASGVTHGLMFLLASLGLLRRDRAAIATGLIGMLFYGGMLMTVLPHTPGVSWQSHMGGAFAGIIAALLFRQSDPMAPRQRYSWEDEEESAEALPDDELEPPSPRRVPVLWQPREGKDYVVLPFRRPGQDDVRRE